MMRREERADTAYIRSGVRYAWRGLPGQYANEATIRVDSMTASCQINACIEFGGSQTLITIGAADLVAAVAAGWLELLPVEFPVVN